MNWVVPQRSAVKTAPRREVLVMIGTRPEAIKLCPVILKLRAAGIETTVCATGQHRELSHEVLRTFEVVPDFDLNVMRPNQSLAAVASILLRKLGLVIRSLRPSIIIVQGDTTTTLCGALAGYYAGVPVAHVDAGVRSCDISAPFPEEMNRCLVTRLATLHFAPTKWAAENLRNEGIAPERIFVTGNTIVDAMRTIKNLPTTTVVCAEGKKVIVVTAHRRENFGTTNLAHICEAIRSIANRGDAQIVWPVHPNPSVSTEIHRRLTRCENILLTPPLSYASFLELICRAHLILTDSGGLQEEAVSLGKPVLILRQLTDRPETSNERSVRLVGTEVKKIVHEAFKILDEPPVVARSEILSVYGDGYASDRIVHIIKSHLLFSARLD